MKELTKRSQDQKRHEYALEQAKKKMYLWLDYELRHGASLRVGNYINPRLLY